MPKFTVLLVTAVAATTAFVIAAVIASSPSLSLKMLPTNGDDLKFQIDSRNINDIMLITFRSETNKEIMWSVKLYCPLSGFTYGVLPTCTSKVVAEPVRQKFPEAGHKPRNIGIGEMFTVEIEYQFDEFFAASASTKKFRYQRLSETEFIELQEEK